MKKETLEGLHRKGLITEETYKRGMRKYADGGVVQNPGSPLILADQAVQPDSAVDPVIQAAEVAKQNTLEQGSKSPFSWMSDVEWNKLSPEQKVAAESPVLAETEFGSTASNLAKQGLEKLGGFISQRKEEDAAKVAAAKGETPKTPPTQMEQLGLQKSEPKPQTPQAQSPYAGVATGLDQAFSQMEQGISQEQQAASQAAGAMSTAYNTAIQDLQKAEQQRQVVEQQRQNRLDEQAKKFQASIDDYQKNSVIDPNRYWANKSTGDKILASIAVFMGGIGGGTNQVMEGIDRTIQRDIDAQKTALASKRDALSLQNNVFANMMNQFQDERAAETASRLAMTNIAEMQFKKIAAGTAGAQAKAKAMLALGELQIKKASLQQDLIKQVQNSPQSLAADDETRAIMRLPENMRNEAFKELGEYRKIKQDVKSSLDLFDQMGNIGLVDRANIFDRDRIKTIKAALVPKVKSVLGEAMQEADVERMVDPLIYGITDSDKAKQRKRDTFIRMLNDAVPGRTPRLQGMGIIRPEANLSLKRND